MRFATARNLIKALQTPPIYPVQFLWQAGAFSYSSLYAIFLSRSNLFHLISHEHTLENYLSNIKVLTIYVQNKYLGSSWLTPIVEPGDHDVKNKKYGLLAKKNFTKRSYIWMSYTQGTSYFWILQNDVSNTFRGATQLELLWQFIAFTSRRAPPPTREICLELGLTAYL